MPAKIIVKSGYIRNIQHMENALYYAGNKIEAQIAVMEDSSTVEAGSVDLLAKEDNYTSVQLTLKNGRMMKLTPQQYQDKVNEREKMQSEQILHWEEGEKTFQAEGYIKYIAYRKSVEKAPNQKHGLFTLDGDADMQAEQEKLREHQDSIMWSHIISLERADAERTGYDHRSAWKNLVTAKSMELAKLYNIDPKNLVVNAAYHDKDHHPHLHLYFYSTDPREGVVKDMQYASTKLKRMFFNEIFEGDVHYLKEVRTDQRGQLEARLEELLRDIGKQSYRPPKKVCDQLLNLSAALKDYKGKNVYAFHSPEIKQQVDELVESIVTTDRHLAHLFDAYLETQHTFLEQYQQDPAKIAARMQKFTEHFFHPRPAQRGRPGTGDRVVLHNKVLRYAKTLKESVFTEPMEKEWKPEKSEPSDKTKGKKKLSAKEILHNEVYHALRESVKDGDAPRPLENEVTTLYNEIKDDEFATAYSYVPLDAKAETRGLLHRMADASEPFQDALQTYLQKLKEDAKKPELTLDLLKKKFYDPGWRDDRKLHDTIVRFSKKLEEQRAVINNNSKVFFTLPDTFQENGDQELLGKLTELNTMVDTTPNDELSFRELEDPVKEKTTTMLAGILNSKEEIEIPKDVKTALLNPDELTPVTFQNTIVKFAKKLHQHQAVTEHNSEVYAALSNSFSKKNSKLLQSLEQLQTLAENIPPEKLTYYEQDLDLRAPANAILKQTFETGNVHVPKYLCSEFLSPDELTPMGFQNTILRFSKKLEVHRAVAACRSEVSLALLDALDHKGSQAVSWNLKKLHRLLADVPNDQMGFRKLEEPTQKCVQDMLAEILNSKEEIEMPEKVKQELLHPDELTPLGLQNTIVRIAKRPDEYQTVNKVRSDLFLLLSKDIEQQTGSASQLQQLGESFQQIPPEDLSYHKLNEEQKKIIADILSTALADADIPQKTLDSLLAPDELTPRTLQNMVIHFADQYEQYKLADRLQKDLFLKLISTADKKSPFQQEMRSLQAELNETEDVSYRNLSDDLQNKVNDLLGRLLKDHDDTKQHPKLTAELLSPRDKTPLGLQTTVIRFTKRYDHYVKQQIRQKAKYTAKLLTRSFAYELAKLARENNQYNPSEPKQQTGLTTNEPKQIWHNYMEPDELTYD